MKDLDSRMSTDDCMEKQLVRARHFDVLTGTFLLSNIQEASILEMEDGLSVFVCRKMLISLTAFYLPSPFSLLFHNIIIKHAFVCVCALRTVHTADHLSQKFHSPLHLPS